MSDFAAELSATTFCSFRSEFSAPAVVSAGVHALPQVHTIKEMVTSADYRHVPTGTLAMLAQPMGRVFASSTTWFRLVRERGWRRPPLRMHPAKPKVGIRADKPDKTWHIDTSIIRLVDGTKASQYAIIDDFSRRILSWRVADRFDPAHTFEILLEASRSRTAGDDPPTVLADGGGENVNGAIDELINFGLLKRVLAMSEIRFSNSMIEAWWRALKHRWLFLHTLDSVDGVRSLVEFYVSEHNERLPHSAFRGQTPDEMDFGGGEGLPDHRDAGKKAARQKRLDMNRALVCAVCEPVDDVEAA